MANGRVPRNSRELSACFEIWAKGWEAEMMTDAEELVRREVLVQAQQEERVDHWRMRRGLLDRFYSKPRSQDGEMSEAELTIAP